MLSIGVTGTPGASVMRVPEIEIASVFLRLFHQRGIMTRTPSASPQLNATSTTRTSGAFQSAPKKK